MSNEQISPIGWQSQASIQSLIDSARESAEVIWTVKIEEVADLSFVDRGRKDLGADEVVAIAAARVED